MRKYAETDVGLEASTLQSYIHLCMKMYFFKNNTHLFSINQLDILIFNSSKCRLGLITPLTFVINILNITRTDS